MRGLSVQFLFLALPILALAGCQPDEAKFAEHMSRASAFVEEEKLPEAIIEYKSALQIDPNSADAHYGLAKAYLQNRQTREGFWELRETARLDPSNLDAKLQFGQFSILAGELEEAIKQAEEVIAADPQRVSAYLLRGRTLEAMRRPKEAREAYESALEIAPEDDGALHLLAIHHRRRGDREAAEPLYLKLTEVKPSALTFTAYAGFLARDRERDAEAEAAYQKAIEVAKPEERARAISILAGFYFSRDRYPRSVEVLEKAIEEEENILELIYLLARFHNAYGEGEKADALIEKATRARPDEAGPQLVLSQYRARKGDLEGALEAAERAVELAPDHQMASLRKAEVLVEIGFGEDSRERIAEGRGIVEAILAREPSNPGALFVKGKIDLAENNVDNAVTALRAAIDSRPDWAQAHFLLGTALALQHEGTMARAELARALEIDAGLIEARKVLAKVHFGLREHDYAIQEGQRYLRERPNDTETRVLVAQSLVYLGKVEEALQELQQVREQDRDANVLYAFGRVHLTLGRGQEARDFFARALELRPQHPDILRSLLMLDRAENRLQDSVARIQAALEVEPENAKLHQLSGIAAMRDGRPQDAERSFRRAILLDPKDLENYTHLARYYSRTERLDETIQIYEKALEAIPDEARLHHFLGVLYESGGQKERAIERYEAAIRYQPDLPEPKNNLAYLLAESGENLDQALDLAQEAKALLPDDPNSADTLGWVLYKRGVPSAAISYLKEAEAGKDPSDSSIGLVRHHLALAYAANDQEEMAREALERALDGLASQTEARRAQGETVEEEEPQWASEARAMLDRLSEAEGEGAPQEG